MIKKIYAALLMSGLISSIVVLPSYAEEVYKSVNKQGTPTFSDAKTEGAETINIEPVNVQTIPTPASPSTTVVMTRPDFNYTKLDIISPADQTTFRNEYKIMVQIAIKPGLRSAHQIEFLNNGQPLRPASKNLSIELTNLERGTHTLTARVLDKNNKVIQTSSAITLNVFRTTVKPAPAPAPTPASPP